MINIKFNGKRFKIGASGKIKCLDECNTFEIAYIKDIIEKVESTYKGPSDVFCKSYGRAFA